MLLAPYLSKFCPSAPSKGRLERRTANLKPTDRQIPTATEPLDRDRPIVLNGPTERPTYPIWMDDFAHHVRGEREFLFLFLSDSLSPLLALCLAPCRTNGVAPIFPRRAPRASVSHGDLHNTRHSDYDDDENGRGRGEASGGAPPERGLCGDQLAALVRACLLAKADLSTRELSQ
jgi:hypothetical protein